MLLLLSCAHADPPIQKTVDKPTTLPAEHQVCKIDTDCVVVPALAGWAEQPPEGAHCKSVCVVAVARTAHSSWLELIKSKAHTIPCDLEMEPCPPDDHFVAQCLLESCTVKFVGTQQK
jgi:hypothetical protein